MALESTAHRLSTDMVYMQLQLSKSTNNTCYVTLYVEKILKVTEC